MTDLEQAAKRLAVAARPFLSGKATMHTKSLISGEHLKDCAACLNKQKLAEALQQFDALVKP